MLRTLLTNLAILLVAISVLSSPANALSYTKYDLTTTNTQFTGYAILDNEARVTRSDNVANFYIKSMFLIPEFSITFDDGLIYSSSGSFSLVDTYFDLDGDGSVEHTSAEDSWTMGAYSGSSGFGFVSLNLNNTPHDLLVSPVTTLPESFGLNNASHYSDESLPSFYGFVFTNPEPVPAPVPEPATYLLLATGLCGVIFIKKRLKSFT